MTLLSLQKGYGAEQRYSCSFSDAFVSCQDDVDQVWDFLETAAIIKNCDLVITSDSAVAHLAGGLGKPTWLLLKYVPEWRWGLEASDTFWYPSVRLFRQTVDGDWLGLMNVVADELKLYLENLLPFSSRRDPGIQTMYGFEGRVKVARVKRHFYQFAAPFWAWLESDQVAGSAEESVNQSLEATNSLISNGGDKGSSSSCRTMAAAVSFLADLFGDDGCAYLHAEALLQSDCPAIYSFLGYIFLKMDCVDRAIVFFRLALKSGEVRADAFACLALCWQMKGRRVRAKGLYQAARRNGCQKYVVASVIGGLLAQNKELAMALEELEAAIG
jgi:hypothetical protein